MMMNGVKNNVRLHFKFVREPQHHADDDDDDDDVFLAHSNHNDDRRDSSSDKDVNNDTTHDEQIGRKRKRKMSDFEATNNGKGPIKDVDERSNRGGGRNNCLDSMDTTSKDKKYTPKTIITYKIDYSVDFGKIERLVGVDIYASDEHPSLEAATPLLNDEIVEEEGDCDYTSGVAEEVEKIDNKSNDAGFDKVDMSDDDDDDDESNDNNNSTPSTENNNLGNGDRFGVYINPENVVAFLDRMNLNLNDRSVFYFLLTFPFYEHEWDIPGFILDALFDDDDNEEEAEDEEEWNFKDQPCCLPFKD